MKLYIAGPMTGYPEWNFPAFREAARELRMHDFEVVSPAEMDEQDFGFDGTGEPPQRMSLHDVLARDLAALDGCDGIILLQGWEHSKGAAVELAYARAKGMPVYLCRNGRAVAEVDASALVEAERLVHGDRRDDYGHPADDFTRTGRMWGAILDQPEPVPPHLVALCMAAVKISRECNRHKRDNLVDLAGYAETCRMVHARKGN